MRMPEPWHALRSLSQCLCWKDVMVWQNNVMVWRYLTFDLRTWYLYSDKILSRSMLPPNFWSICKMAQQWERSQTQMGPIPYPRLLTPEGKKLWCIMLYIANNFNTTCSTALLPRNPVSHCSTVWFIRFQSIIMSFSLCAVFIQPSVVWMTQRVSSRGITHTGLVTEGIHKSVFLLCHAKSI